MRFFITTCSKNKLLQTEPLPAIKRYTDSRIGQVYQLSLQQGAGFAILSGKYGLLLPQQPIIWYDEALTLAKLPDVLPLVTQQLQQWQPTHITFFAKNPHIYPDWLPYYLALYQPCMQMGIPFELSVLP